MYVATVPNRNSPPAILLRESFREDGKVKNRTLANLSSWPSERVDALRRLLRGDLDHLVSDTPVCGPVFGQLHALKQIADRLGITAALGRGPKCSGFPASTRTISMPLWMISVLARCASKRPSTSAIGRATQSRLRCSST